MPTNLNLETLRELAAFRTSEGCAISLYLDLDPQSTINPGDVRTHVRSLLDVGGRNAGFESEGLTRDQKQALKEDVERIKRFFADDFDRSGMCAFALYSSSLDGLWSTLPLQAAVRDDVRLGRDLFLTPLLPLIGRGEGALVAVVGRERGEVYRLKAGRLEQLVDEFDEAPSQHDQGGLSQTRYRRHIDEIVGRHVRGVCEQIDRLVRLDPAAELVIVAADDIRHEIEATLAPESRNAIVGWATAEAHAGATELLEAARPALGQARVDRERRALDRWREEAARDGRAAAGWQQTIEAASDGRVELLLVQEAVDHEAYECPECGRGSATNGACPLDGTAMERRPDGLDVAVHQTLEHGGSVWVAAGNDLAPVEGIGALLRY